MHAPGTGLVKVESVKIRPPPSWGRCVEGSSFPAVEILTGRTRRAEGPLQGTDRGLPLQSFLFDVTDLNRDFPMIRDAINGLMRARVRRERSGRSTLAFFCAAGERSIEEVWSGADRRSRRQRSGRSVHRRDAMRNSSDRFGVGHCGATKQRGTIPLYSCRRRSLGREGLSALWVIGAGGEVIGNSLNELIR